jgi:Nucleolar pre-ribosomal-associated protein 1
VIRERPVDPPPPQKKTTHTHFCGLSRTGLCRLGLDRAHRAPFRSRGLAYEVLAEYCAALESAGERFREAKPLAALLAFVRNGVRRPFQQLPAISAVFAAEAAMQLTRPDGAAYGLISKLLLRKAALDVEVGPADHPSLKPVRVLFGM